MSETKQYDEDWVNEFLRHLQEGPVEPERAEAAEKIRRIIDTDNLIKESVSGHKVQIYGIIIYLVL